MKQFENFNKSSCLLSPAAFDLCVVVSTVHLEENVYSKISKGPIHGICAVLRSAEFVSAIPRTFDRSVVDRVTTYPALIFENRWLTPGMARRWRRCAAALGTGQSEEESENESGAHGMIAMSDFTRFIYRVVHVKQQSECLLSTNKKGSEDQNKTE